MSGINNLYNQMEQVIDSTIKSLSVITNKDFGFLESFSRLKEYYDEPKFWHYLSTINSKFTIQVGRDFTSTASGVSLFSQKVAIVKCLGESIERYCNHAFFEDTTAYQGSYKNIKRKGVNLWQFSRFSQEQLEGKKFSRFQIDEDDIFRWTACQSLIDSKEYLVPSHYVYLSYPYLPNEKSLYPGISTGVAAGSCLASAILRGIHEIIERDSYMIFYLNKLDAPRIDLESINEKKLQSILSILRRYNLELVSLDITTDLNIPVIASVIVDRTGIGKAISIGLKSHLDVITALLGSIEEALHSRSWIRSEFEKNNKEIQPKDLLKDDDLLLRGLLWYSPKSIDKLDFWLKSKRVSKLKVSDINLNHGQQLMEVLKRIKPLDYAVYYKDITHSSFQKLKYFVVKVIIPQTQPLYLDEEFPILGGNRLYEVPKKLGYSQKRIEEFNNYPHPFL